MSEPHEEHREASDASSAGPAASLPPSPVEKARPRRGAARAVAFSLAVLLAVIVAGLASSPFWAPAVAPLFPWGGQPPVSAEEHAALAARVAAIETRPAPPVPDFGPLKSEMGALSERVDRLASATNARLAGIEKRPAPPQVDLDAVKSADSALAQRLDATETGAAEAKSALQQLEHRVDDLEARLSSRAASEAADLQKQQQELTRIDSMVADLANRLPAIARQAQSQNAGERKEAMETLLLMQMREAVDQARPFEAEYSAFKALDNDPELASASEPLAEAAHNGVAGRAVLNERLADLGARITSAAAPPAEADWGAQALARLRGLVTIRRIDGGPQTGPEGAIGAARASLARGDLAGAVAIIEKLTGTAAEAAGPWLKMARERLSVERALDRLQQILTARAGSSSPNAPAAAPAETSPAKSPS